MGTDEIQAIPASHRYILHIIIYFIIINIHTQNEITVCDFAHPSKWN